MLKERGGAQSAYSRRTTAEKGRGDEREVHGAGTQAQIVLDREIARGVETRQIRSSLAWILSWKSQGI